MMKTEPVFVFGSNEAGIHGAGAAKAALKLHGAKWSYGVGHHGNSYAIPTKNYSIRTLPLRKVEEYINQFIEYAKDHPELTFKVTCIGCGLAGFTHYQIAPLFNSAPDNCLFDELWKEYLPKHKYWGTL